MAQIGPSVALLLAAAAIALVPLPVAPPVRAWGATIAALFALQILLKDAAHALLARRLRPWSAAWKLLVAPGTVLHELSHALAALAVGARVRRVALFRPDPWTGTLGYVEYVNPPGAGQVLRDLAIGFAPFFGCGAVAVGAALLLAPGALPAPAAPTGVEAAAQGFLEVARFQVAGLAVLRWSDPLSWALLYLLLTLGYGAAPSSTDFSLSLRSVRRHPVGGLAAAGVVLLLLMGGEPLLPAFQAAGVLLFASLFWLPVSLGVLALAQRV